MDFDEYLERIVKNRFIPVPPQQLYNRFFPGGDEEFRTIGVHMLRNLVKFAELRPSHRVIDIGSGVGRIALPLTQWLDESGKYTGVDIIREGVEWCSANISSNYLNFDFEFLDVYNEHYNPQGRYSLPQAWKNRSLAAFDVAIFCSVFTHLWLEDARFYLRLMHRFLVDDGAIWMTWFIVDDEARRSLADRRTTIPFGHEEDGVHFLSKQGSTAAVGYDASLARSLIESSGFRIERLRLGGWCDRAQHENEYQDLIVARKIPSGRN